IFAWSASLPPATGFTWRSRLPSIANCSTSSPPDPSPPAGTRSPRGTPPHPEPSHRGGPDPAPPDRTPHVDGNSGLTNDAIADLLVDSGFVPHRGAVRVQLRATFPASGWDR